MRGRHSVASVAVFLGLCLTAVQAPAEEPAPRIQADVQMQPVVPVSNEERRAIYIAAGRVLKHVDEARSALRSRDRAQAEHHVRQAILLTDIIRAALPTYRVKAEIQAGELRYRDEDLVRQTVVPIFEELEREAILAPVRAAKAAALAEDEMTDAPTAIVDVAQVHTRAELDIESARERLDLALERLAQNRLDAADALLKAIQVSVRLTRVEVDLPLEEARSNLMLARDRIDEGRLEEARFALRVAMDALAEYQETVQEERAKEVAALHTEMSRLEVDLQRDSRKARQKIEAWWDILARWSAEDDRV